MSMKLLAGKNPKTWIDHLLQKASKDWWEPGATAQIPGSLSSMMICQSILLLGLKDKEPERVEEEWTEEEEEEEEINELRVSAIMFRSQQYMHMFYDYDTLEMFMIMKPKNNFYVQFHMIFNKIILAIKLIYFNKFLLDQDFHLHHQHNL